MVLEKNNYQEAPETLPKDMLKSIKRSIAKRILSEKAEKWWTVSTCYNEIDTLEINIQMKTIMKN